eukprot:CAMPEP_0174913474 /NCGR_PEP_ID=MMETSP0167-20121228/80341_1 /TAXON_ID=38298 /ORGANISM="Rhodella maculata, Strain CCMP736" /LENGTH=394 /DNA_ID=CAMNT_0016158199 /DNA_START=101 /DNA_END=1286 /DNA_ORIENTATION=+
MSSLPADTKRAAKELFWTVTLANGRLFVSGIRRFLNWWVPPHQQNYHLKGTSRVGGPFATDGVTPPARGVSVKLFAHRYGLHPSETLDTLLCDDRNLAQRKPPVLYAHGGAWIAASSACLLHSVAPVARAGFDVFSMDYPLAPAARFPEPVVSVLRALAWMAARGRGEVLLMGDSAGGNLVSLAAALVANRPLLEEFADGRLGGRESGVAGGGVGGESAAVGGVRAGGGGGGGGRRVAVSENRGGVEHFGVMDQVSWSRDLDTISQTENQVMHFLTDFALRLYRCPDGRFQNKLTIVDVLDDVAELPPFQLICGNKDVLVWTNRQLRLELEKRNFRVEYFEYDERHCFFGFPPAWLSEEGQAESKAALGELLRFFQTHSDLYFAEVKDLRNISS